MNRVGFGKGDARLPRLSRSFGSSGLNRSQFCRRQGLTLGVLNRCLKRLGAACGGGATSDGLVAVELAGQRLSAERADGCDLAVVLASGRRIAVSTGFDAATLQRLVQVLETM